MNQTRYWSWHMAAGVAIFVLLGLHMATMHMGGLTGLFVADRSLESAAEPNSQARDALLSMTVMYVLLLGIALFHGLYGLRTILFELTLKPATERAISVVLFIAGLGLFAFGTWAAIVAHNAASLARG
jgi:succinate dehydrogenase/fumarate reductase cytochrome b subunit